MDASGVVFVADLNNNRIQAFTGDGAFLSQWGSFGTGPGEFYRPATVAVSPDGRLFVADTWNSRLQIFGSLPTPARATTWGRLKSLYR